MPQVGSPVALNKTKNVICGHIVVSYFNSFLAYVCIICELFLKFQ